MESYYSSFMNWAYLSFTTSSLLFGLIFTLLYYVHRNRYLKLWSASYAVIASAYLFLYIVLAFNYSFLIPLYLFAIVSGSYLFYRASLDYMHCQEKPIWKILMGLAIVLTAGMVYSEYMLIYGWVIFSIFTGLFYLNSGILFVRSKDNINRLVGSMILILSLMIFVSPLIMDILWTLPWFYFINGMLGLIVTLGILGLHFRSLNQVLIKSQQELKAITDNMTEQVSVVDLEGRFTFVSKNHYDLYGYTVEELFGRHAWELIHHEYLSKMVDMFRDHVSKEEKGRAEFKAVKKDGSLVWVEIISSILKENGQINGALMVTRDISDRKLAEEALRVNEGKYRFLAENMGDVAWTMDLDLNTTYISPSSTRVFGFTPEERMQQTVDQIMPSESLIIIAQKLQEELDKEANSSYEPEREILIESEFYYKNGGTVWMESLVKAMRDSDGKITGIYGSSRDITERKKAEEQIRYIGFHDQLTDLYNRYYFEACEEELKDIPVLSVIMTDVNGLKLINDTYGHEAGDELLKKYVELLKKSFKQSDLIFRWGGDEFIVILKNTEEAKSWELCNRLIKHCGETFVKGIPLSISVGISSKLHGGDVDEAIKEAEDMMYKNKLTESKSSKNLIMKTLLQTLSEKSFETKEHIGRMTSFGSQFGERLGLSSSELSRLETLTMLHDIGKINLDSHILLKETALTDKEWEEIKKHPEVGYRIIRTAEEFSYVAEEILAHHERWDGKGYPQGLQGEDIPYLARLLNIIDSYDVMSNGRPYKKKMSSEEIIEEIERCSGKQFDPDLAKEFITCLKEGAIAYQ